MKFPKHLTLTLNHNEHLNYYSTVAEEYRNALWVSEEQKKKATDTNECWSIQIYPDTPIGFYYVAAADLDVLLEFINDNT